MNENLTFDERAIDYSSSTNLMPQTWKGDVETAYTVACSDQLELDKKFYTPCINYMKQAIEKLSEMVSSNDSHTAQKWISGMNEQLSKIPYHMRQLPSGSYIKTDSENA